MWNTKCAPFTAASKEPSFNRSASCSSSLPVCQRQPCQQADRYLLISEGDKGALPLLTDALVIQASTIGRRK